MVEERTNIYQASLLELLEKRIVAGKRVNGTFPNA